MRDDPKSCREPPVPLTFVTVPPGAHIYNISIRYDIGQSTYFINAIERLFLTVERRCSIVR